MTSVAGTGPTSLARRGGPATRLVPLILALCCSAVVADAQTLTGGPQSILSTPLPGTLAREDHDLARLIEQALVDFEDVKAARVLITRSDATDETPASRRAAVQLTLAEDAWPASEWVSAIADFTLQAVPCLDATLLTVVDSTGRTLYSAGVVRVVPPPAPAALAQAPMARPLSPWLVLLGVALGALIAAVALLVRHLGRRTEALEPPTGPFAFMHELTDEALAVALGGERPAVVAAVLAELDGGTAAKATRALGLRQAPTPTREPPAEVLAAVADAMRRKLSEAGLR